VYFSLSTVSNWREAVPAAGTAFQKLIRVMVDVIDIARCSVKQQRRGPLFVVLTLRGDESIMSDFEAVHVERGLTLQSRDFIQRRAEESTCSSIEWAVYLQTSPAR
jgi:hypothetical protein